MSPLDDELRAALRGRASVLTPAPDPLAGIERRAKRIRRNRVAASVAGSALAVAAIALAVPALVPNALPDQLPPPIALAVSPQPTSPAALDLNAPWPYRGAGDVIANGQLEKFTLAWAAMEGVSADQVDFIPLYGEVVLGDGQVVYAARVLSSGAMEYGLVTSPEGDPQFLSRTTLTRDSTALLVPAPGDGEFVSLLVVAAPDSRAVEYAQDGTSFAPMASPAPGVGSTLVEGDGARDAVRVVAADGREIFRGAAPAFSDSGEPPVEQAPTEKAPPIAGAPDNLLGWPFRGEANGPLEERAAKAFAKEKGVSRREVTLQVLFTGSNETGQKYTVLQGYAPGQRAQVFGWIESPGFDPELQLRPETEAGTPVVAILLTTIPFPLGTPIADYVDRLVLVVEPGTTQVLYRERDGEQGSPVTDGPPEGVAVVDRKMFRQNVPFTDSITVLDAAGRQTLDAPVSSLLCGLDSCS